MSDSSIQDFITFLRNEAQQAEDRARRLRRVAAGIQVEEDKKEVGKKQKRKRSSSNKTTITTTSTTESHNNNNLPSTAYSLFVHENFDVLRKDHMEMPVEEIMSILDQQWNSISEEEKRIWTLRVQQQQQPRNEVFPTMPGLPSLDYSLLEGNDLDGDETRTTKRHSSQMDSVADTISV